MPQYHHVARGTHARLSLAALIVLIAAAVGGFRQTFRNVSQRLALSMQTDAMCPATHAAFGFGFSLVVQISSRGAQLSRWMAPVFLAVGVRASLNVMSRDTDLFAAQLREAIVMDERELDITGARHRPSSCSSLHDAPTCVLDALDDATSSFDGTCADQSIGNALSEATRSVCKKSNLGSGKILRWSGMVWNEGDTWDLEIYAARVAVDGVFPPWASTLGGDPAVEHWADRPETQHAFRDTMRNYVQKRFRSMTGAWAALGSQAGMEADDAVAEGAQRRRRRSSEIIDSRAKSRCFLLRLAQLPPWLNAVPRTFSGGLAPFLSLVWDGWWEAAHRPGQSVGLATQAILRSKVGYLRFANPCVVRRLLLSMPWQGGDMIVVCGFLDGDEQWCVRPAVFAATPTYSQRADVDVGNSLLAVDEVVLSQDGLDAADGVGIASMEVVATSPATRGAEDDGLRRVVLLRRRRGIDDESSFEFEPSVTLVSGDAAVWNVNDILRGRVRLRSLPVDGVELLPAVGGAPEVHSTIEMRDGLRACRTGSIFCQLSRQFRRAVFHVCHCLQTVCPAWELVDVQKAEPTRTCRRIIWFVFLLNMCWIPLLVAAFC